MKKIIPRKTSGKRLPTQKETDKREVEIHLHNLKTTIENSKETNGTLLYAKALPEIFNNFLRALEYRKKTVAKKLLEEFIKKNPDPLKINLSEFEELEEAIIKSL